MTKKREVIDLTNSTAKWVDLTTDHLGGQLESPYIPPGTPATMAPLKMTDTPISGPSVQSHTLGLKCPPSSVNTSPHWYTTYQNLATQSQPPLSYYSPSPSSHHSMSAYYAAAAAPGATVSKFSYAKLPNYFDHTPVEQTPVEYTPLKQMLVEKTPVEQMPGLIENRQPDSSFHPPKEPPAIPITKQEVKQAEEVIDIETDKPALSLFGKTALKRATCKDCKKSLLSNEKDVSRLTKKWANGELQMSSILVCPKDGGTACAGCGKQKESPRRFFRRTQKQTPQNTNLTCTCEESRLFLIWALLCAAEHQKACNERRDSYFSKPRSMSDPAKGSRSKRLTSGTGYGDGGQGSGFSGLNMIPFNSVDMDEDLDMPALEAQMLHTKKPSTRRKLIAPPTKDFKDKNDDVLGFLFKSLTELLPNLQFPNPEKGTEKSGSFDQDPPSVLIAMIKRSPILDKAAELLRNDSLAHITQRKDVYQNLLDFLHRLAVHPATSSAVLQDRIVYPSDAGLLSVSFNVKKHELRGIVKSKAETAVPLANIVTTLQVPCRSMLQRSKAVEDEFQTTEGKIMLNMCRAICDFYDFLQTNVLGGLPSLSEPQYKGKGKAPMKQEDSVAQWHKENCVKELSDDAFKSNFYYNRDANGPSTVVPAKGRMKQLVIELGALQASLPEGIYVRYSSSRLDMMKVMIMGPKNTPYEGGLFEFDLFCPMTYPTEPPKMHFMTTGGGTAHFNPNLYTDGKVCLSLLGTWSGQPWIPKQSTLLQVFVSLQAMVFCDEPWYNEPGREHQPNPAASHSYNILIQSLTIPHAMTYWLSFKDHPIWQDVIDKHFSLHGDTILATIKTWNAAAAPSRANTIPRPQFSGPYYPNGHGPASKLPGQVSEFEKALQSRSATPSKRKQSNEEQGGRPFMGGNF